ncbi:MAG: hypothetical protein Q8M83_00740 [bacterium]|nr:hypothetical protein [bacterium]
MNNLNKKDLLDEKGLNDEEQGGDVMQGKVIKDIYKNAEQVAHLHATLTSPRGKYFRKKLLHMLADGLTAEEIVELTKEFGVEEYKRHINKFVDCGFITIIEIDGKEGYVRTALGEEALNLTRKLERKIGPEKSEAIYKASLGPNSIRLFLKIYGHKHEVSHTTNEIIYTPLEIGHLATFLPRTIEGLAAIDKIDDAGLVSYLDDGRIHLNPRRCVAFYQYLKGLYELIESEHN